ncbi:MAG: UDP-N-acetylenolpyruvoylglucosamine reductase, partial [Candidatus Hydrogenedentota bacterium]
ATAMDIYRLAELVRETVWKKTGVLLEYEIVRIGF